jgi:uncharacterized cupredoxin-like copper-binding protein
MFLVCASLLLATALATSPKTARPRPHADDVVKVVTTDFRFDMPPTLTAGPTTFQVVNRGKEVHQLYLARLAEGKRAADFVNALKAGGPPPSWATDVGGPNGVDPGTSSPLATVQLAPGHYAALCVIPSPDGVPHIMKGMFADVAVTPGIRTASSSAKPDLTISLVDYGYSFATPLTAGSHRIRVRNDGKQSHELEIARLLPGKTPADLAAWAEKMAGPPPAHFVGGISPIAPGQSNDLSLTLTPGHYVMLCFLPDAKDKKPHTAHGMVHDFVVK